MDPRGTREGSGTRVKTRGTRVGPAGPAQDLCGPAPHDGLWSGPDFPLESRPSLSRTPRTRVNPRGPTPHNLATSLPDERCLGPAQHHMKSGGFEGGVGPAPRRHANTVYCS